MLEAGPVDVQTHFLPEAVVAALAARPAWPRLIEGGGRREVEYGPGVTFPLGPEMESIDTKLEAMDAAGIAVSVLSVTPSGLDFLDAATATAVARDANDELAAATAAHGRRLAALATLPMQAPQAAAAELERAVAEGLAGAMIYSNVAGRYLDEPAFRDVFEVAARLKVPLALHPTFPVNARGLEDHGMLTGVGFVYDTSTATLRLLFDGLFERHPDLRFLLAHVGGILPYVSGRLDYAWERRRARGGTSPGPPSELLQRIYVDAVCSAPRSLAFAIDFFGDDHVLYATDHPFWDPARTNDTLARVSLTDGGRDRVLSGNARALFALSGPPA
jgi:aminocarboxymuconate-semialdehyde decarboxylase